jgi:hypothetical protein
VRSRGAREAGSRRAVRGCRKDFPPRGAEGDLVGEPGAEIRLLRGPTPAFLAQASWRGPILERWRNPQSDLIAPWVVLDGTGHGTLTIGMPPVEPGDVLRTFLQPYRRHAHGTCTVGGVVPVTVVDASY